MSNWFFLALLSPALFSIVNLIDDNLLRNVYRTPYFGAIITGLFALLPLTLLFFKPIYVQSNYIVILAVLSGFLTVAYYFFYFKALEVEVPSVVIALFSLSYVFIPILAFIFLNEKLYLRNYIGASIIIFSSIAITAINIKKLKFSRALYLVGFAGVLFAVIALFQKYVYSHIDFYSGYIFFSFGMGLGSLFFALSFRKGRLFVKQFKNLFKKWILILAAAELINIAAEFTINLAISRGPVSLVKVIEGSQPIYVLLFALILAPFFPKYAREAHEGKIFKKLTLMAAMLLGLYFIYS